jgi:DNA-binding IclR family transcriptional regulator
MGHKRHVTLSAEADRVLRLLVEYQDEALSISQIERMTNLSKETICEILDDLAFLGFVQKSPAL